MTLAIIYLNELVLYLNISVVPPIDLNGNVLNLFMSLYFLLWLPRERSSTK